MNIGIIKETKSGRVLINPETSKKLISKGHNVFFVTGCGYDSGITDSEYLKSGCIKKFTNEDLIKDVNLIVSCKLPKRSLLEKLLNKQIILCNSECVKNKNKIDIISRKSATLLAIEYFKNKEKYEIEDAISRMVASVTVSMSSYIYNNPPMGYGSLVESLPFNEKTVISIIGYGSLGKKISESFVGKNCIVNVFDKELNKLGDMSQRINYSSVYDKNFNSLISKSDIVYATSYDRKKHIKPFIKKEVVENMKKKSIIFDLTMNNGGTFETSKKTNNKDPFYVYKNVIHCCPDDILENIPKNYSSYLSNYLFNYIYKIIEDGFKNKNFRNSVIVYNGKVAKDIDFIEEDIDYSCITDPFDLMDTDISSSWKADDINEYLDDVDDYSYEY